MGTSFTEQYEPYSFDDDIIGPGCGHVEHDAGCMCDVDQVTVDEIASRSNAPTLALGELAKQALLDRRKAPTFENFASELLGLFEKGHELGVHLKATAGELEELRCEYHLNETGRLDRQATVKLMLNAGLGVGAIARFVGVSAQQVIADLGVKPLPGVAAAVDMLVKGAHSEGAVARATGISQQQAGRLKEVLGVETQVVACRRRGGGYKYTAEQIADVRRRRANNESWGDIAKATGISRDVARNFVRRHNEAA